MQRQILVTGGNSGIGLEMVRTFVRSGHEVVIAARDAAKTRQVIQSLQQEVANARLHAVALDLASHASIDEAAREVLNLLPALDTVMVNAGSYTHGLRRQPDGLESMIGSMHFGHFRLMNHLLPRLRHAGKACVVVTSSLMHWVGKIDEACIHDPEAYASDMQAYGSAKLANLIYARELARREAAHGIRVNAFHPGGVATGIWREMPGPLQKVVDKVLITPAKGADTAVWLALDPAAAGFSGEYFVRRKRAMTRAVSKDPAVATRLWTLSEEIAGR